MLSRSAIPNTFTALNLACGIISILKTMQQEYLLAGVFIILAMAADACDGRAARYFGVSGDFGKELDSLCDVVSFGAAPAVLIFQMHLGEFQLLYLLVTVVFAVCAAFRLARFNLDTANVQGYFMGLPSPAAGCFLATFAISGLMVNPCLVAGGVLVIGLLMYSTVRYPDFKGKGNPVRKISAIFGIALAIYMLYALPAIAIPFVLFFSYIVTGILNYLYVQFTGGY